MPTHPTYIRFFFKGASAVLIYGVVEAPLAQPRALFGDHFIGALIGICITRLYSIFFQQKKFTLARWIALMCGVSRFNANDWHNPPTHRSGRAHTRVKISRFGISDCFILARLSYIYIYIGATAILAAVNTEIREIGWYYLPVVLLSSALALVVALITNNVQRWYPPFLILPFHC